MNPRRDMEQAPTSRASVVVCVLNREEAIGDCLRSLEAQTHGNLEVVVVDDGSTDGTPRRLEELRGELPGLDLVVVTNPRNLGISASRNVGVAAASGEIVLFTDSDCLADPGWVREHVTAFGEARLVATGGRVVDHPRTYAERAFAGTSRTGVSKTQGRILVGNNMAFRRAVIEAYGFDPAMSYYCDDDELAWRLEADGSTMRHVDSALVHHYHRLDLGAYLRMARLQGQGSARYWYKTGRYLGRDVLLWFVAAVLGLGALVAGGGVGRALGLLALLTVAAQIAVLLFAETAYKGKSLGGALATLPVVVVYNLVKSLSVALTLGRIALGGEPAVRRSRTEWRQRRRAGATGVDRATPGDGGSLDPDRP